MTRRPAVRSLLPGLMLRTRPAPLILMVVLFVPAGTLAFWRGWAYRGLFLASVLLLVICF